MLRAWMAEAVAPGARLRRAARPLGRRGRLAAAGRRRDRADAPPERRRRWSLPATRTATRRALRHGSPLTVGVDAGAWCAYGAPADMPPDQRREDAQSLSLRHRAPGRAARAPRPADGHAAGGLRPPGGVRRRPAVRRVARRQLDADHPRGAQPLPPPRPRPARSRSPPERRSTSRSKMKSSGYRAARRSPAAPRPVDELLAVAMALARAGDAVRAHRRRRARCTSRRGSPQPPGRGCSNPSSRAETADPLAITWLRAAAAVADAASATRPPAPPPTR